MAPTALTAAAALSNPAGTSPTKFLMDTADVSDVASLTTVLTGANNDLVWTAVTPGAAGNSLTIAYVDPPGNNVSLSVAVVGTAITVTLATDGSSVITSTASQVRALVNADGTAGALVQGANSSPDTGAGVVTALAPTALAGGDTGGNTFTNNATSAVLVRNDHGSVAKTVTVRDSDGVLQTAVSLAAAQSVMFGPFDPDLYGASVTIEGQSTDIKMRVMNVALALTPELALEGAKGTVDAAWASTTSPGAKRALRRVSHKMAVAIRRIDGVNPAPLQHEEP